MDQTGKFAASSLVVRQVAKPDIVTINASEQQA